MSISERLSHERAAESGCRLLTTAEAAERLGLAKSTLDKARLTGTGPAFVRLGTSIRYRQSDLDAWVEANIRRSTSDRGEVA